MRAIRLSLYALPLLFGALFFVVPLVAIFGRALFSDGALALDEAVAVLQDRGTWRVIGFSAWQALLSTLGTLLLALPTAYAFARYDIPAKAVWRALAAVPFVLPTVVVALAFGALLSETGWLNRWLMDWFGLVGPPIQIEDSLTLVLLAHIFYNFTVVLRIVGGYWSSTDPRIEEAARVLGANRWQVWREVTLPLAAPAVLAAALLVFTFTFAAFGTVLILGGPRMRTIEVEIYDLAVNQFKLPAAAILSLLQMAMTLVLTMLYTRLQRRAAVPQTVRPQPVRPARGWRSRALVGLSVSLIVVLVVLPLGALVAGAFQLRGEWTTAHFARLWQNQRGSFDFVSPVRAMLNSLRFAGLTTILALGLGIPAAYLLARPRSWLTAFLDPLFMLPLGTSAVTLGFGYIIAYRSYALPWGWATPDIRREAWLLPVAHTLLALPFVIRTLLPALRRLDRRLHEAAGVLGASPRRIWSEIDLPLLTPALIVSALFAFTVSLGDFGAALILTVTGPDNVTMPVVIFRYLGQPGPTNYGQALAMSALLMLVSLMSFAVIERLRGPESEF